MSRYPDAVGDADPIDLVSTEDAVLALERARLVVAYAEATVDTLEHGDTFPHRTST